MTEEIIKVKVQRMFPNCETKYGRHCRKKATCDVRLPQPCFGEPLPKPRLLSRTKTDDTTWLKCPDGFEIINVANFEEKI